MKTLLALFALLMLSACADEPAPTILGHSDADNRIVWSWNPPETGTPVATYIMYVDWKLASDYVVLGITNNYHGITRIEGDAVRVKVAGIDSAGIQGPYSIWSEDFSTHRKDNDHQDIDLPEKD